MKKCNMHTLIFHCENSSELILNRLYSVSQLTFLAIQLNHLPTREGRLVFTCESSDVDFDYIFRKQLLSLFCPFLVLVGETIAMFL